MRSIAPTYRRQLAYGRQERSTPADIVHHCHSNPFEWQSGAQLCYLCYLKIAQIAQIAHGYT